MKRYLQVLALCAFFVPAALVAGCGEEGIPGNAVAEVDGTPIEGGPTSDQATPITAGTFSDEIGPQGSATGERWYRFDRTMDDSSLLAGLVLLSGRGIGGTSIGVQISTEDGTVCGVSGSASSINAASLFGVGTTSQAYRGSSPDNPCLADDAFYVKVYRALAGGADDSRYTLRLAEQPEVMNADQLPGELSITDGAFDQPETTGAATPVTGGSSLGDATEITDGAYSGTIVPGETQVFKIHVDWGQQLGVQAVIPAATPALLHSGQTQEYAGLQILNPLGAADPDQPNGIELNGFGSFTTSQVLETGTIPVRWNNRLSTSTSYLAGDYYVTYAAAPDVQGSSLEMPFTLRVAVVGEPSGAPTYADGQTLQTAAATQDDSSAAADPSAEPSTDPSADPAGPTGPTADPTTRATDGPSTAPDARPAAAETSGTSRVQLAAAGGLGLVALICAGVGVAFLRRPRRT